MISKLKFLTSHYDRLIDYDNDAILYVQKEVIENKRTIYALDLYSRNMIQLKVDADSDPFNPTGVQQERIFPAPANDQEIYIANNFGDDNDYQVKLTAHDPITKAINVDVKNGQDYTENILQYFQRDGVVPPNNKVKIAAITKPLPTGITFDPVTNIVKITGTTKPGENNIEFRIRDNIQGFAVPALFKINYIVTILK